MIVLNIKAAKEKSWMAFYFLFKRFVVRLYRINTITVCRTKFKNVMKQDVKLRLLFQ